MRRRVSGVFMFSSDLISKALGVSLWRRVSGDLMYGSNPDRSEALGGFSVQCQGGLMSGSNPDRSEALGAPTCREGSLNNSGPNISLTRWKCKRCMWRLYRPPGALRPELN